MQGAWSGSHFGPNDSGTGMTSLGKVGSNPCISCSKDGRTPNHQATKEVKYTENGC